jgi:hypothetical protein
MVGPAPPPGDPPNNQDGHVSISRRGLLAAGLTVAVVGTLGVVSTMNAGAAETPAAAPASPAAVPAVAPGSPPPLLPWGAKPRPIKKGARGASSRALAKAGASAAENVVTPGTVTNYGPKGEIGIKKSRTDVPPTPPGRTVKAATTDAEVDFLYARGTQYATPDSVSALLTVAAPKVADVDWHSLAEVTLESADAQQIVEVGWNVDAKVNGDADTHLFVYTWTDGVGNCYNACGYVPYAPATVAPGATLGTGVLKQFGIQHYNGAWWIAYDTAYIGSFPDSVWGGKFVQAGIVQAFAEVAASSTWPCGTQMGNGVIGSDSTSAKISSTTYTNGPTVKLDMIANDPYTIAPTTDRTFHYGGPIVGC